MVNCTEPAINVWLYVPLNENQEVKPLALGGSVICLRCALGAAGRLAFVWPTAPVGWGEESTRPLCIKFRNAQSRVSCERCKRTSHHAKAPGSQVRTDHIVASAAFIVGL